MKKILVAGATGYLGKYVVREFEQQGFWVRALVRDKKKLSEPGPFREPAVLDCLDEIFVGEAISPSIAS